MKVNSQIQKFNNVNTPIPWLLNADQVSMKFHKISNDTQHHLSSAIQNCISDCFGDMPYNLLLYPQSRYLFR